VGALRDDQAPSRCHLYRVVGESN
jgi:hypothetical protein